MTGTKLLYRRKVHVLRKTEINYLLKVRPKKIIQIHPTNKAMEMIKLWNQFGTYLDSTQKVVVSKPTKTLQKTLDACKWYLNGTIFVRKEFVYPQFNRIDKRKYSIKEFKQSLDYFEFLVRHSRNHFLQSRKFSLLTYILGDIYTQTSSILFSHCSNEPDGFKKPIKITTESKEFLELLESLNDNFENSQKDCENVDKFLQWGIPYYTELWENLNSLRSYYDSPFGILFQFTFGALRQFKEKGRSVSSSLLNQPFFRDMIDEYRKFQGFVD